MAVVPGAQDVMNLEPHCLSFMVAGVGVGVVICGHCHHHGSNFNNHLL